jgi:hypothetical protein
MSDSVPNTLAGFKAAFFDASKRRLTEQDIFDAGVRSGMARAPSQHANSDLYKEGYHAGVAAASADLNLVYDAFGIGALSRTISVLLENVRNASRRSQCLSAIEREFFTTEVPADLPEEEGDTVEECPLSWGAAPTDYVEQFRAALADTLRGQRDPLSDEDIDTIAESMPGGLVGFVKGWGWRNFARAVEAEVLLAAKPAQDDVPLAFPYAFLVTACESLNDLSPLEVLHGSALKDITPEPCQTRILDLPLNERNAKVITLWKLHQAEEADATDYEALEREHLGDPVKRTGIYQWRDTGLLETGDPA